MEKSAKLVIEDFLSQEHIALAGYSQQPKKFGHAVYKTLKEKGYATGIHKFHRKLLGLFGRLPD